ncbi:MAG: hypothetical protein KAW52_01430, partial [candidate division Zixibacteria bacterium]|nr:hypothetical protein [candidate division Zixibacteria bacterium]
DASIWTVPDNLFPPSITNLSISPHLKLISYYLTRIDHDFMRTKVLFYFNYTTSPFKVKETFKSFGVFCFSGTRVKLKLDTPVTFCWMLVFSRLWRDPCD